MIFYTQAPQAYDWSYIVEHVCEYRSSHGETWRCIEVREGQEDAFYGLQVQRYASGLYPVWSQDEFIDLGLK